MAYLYLFNIGAKSLRISAPVGIERYTATIYALPCLMDFCAKGFIEINTSSRGSLLTPFVSQIKTLSFFSKTWKSLNSDSVTLSSFLIAEVSSFFSLTLTFLRLGFIRSLATGVLPSCVQTKTPSIKPTIKAITNLVSNFSLSGERHAD